MWIHFYKKSQSPWDWVRALIAAWVWWSRHRGGPWWPECQGHVAASEKPPRCGAHAWSPCRFSEGVSAGVENGSRREGRSVYCLFVVLLVAMVLVIPSMVAVVVIEVVIVVVITRWWRKNSSVFDPAFCFARHHFTCFVCVKLLNSAAFLWDWYRFYLHLMTEETLAAQDGG